MNLRKVGRSLAAGLLVVALTGTAMAESYTTLRYKDQGESVRQMQTALNALGYSTNGVDGKFGSGTENAVRLFQRRNGLKEDGKAGSATLTLLYQLAAGTSSSGNASTTPSGSGSTSGSGLFGGNYGTLEYGSRGSRVTTLQNALNQLGYSAGNADGKFGAGTQRAVVAFQQAQGLEADGKAGRATLTRLETAISGGSNGSATQPETPTTPTTPSDGGSATVTPTRTLRKGYTGDDVRSVQTKLKELGYYTGTVDGQYGTGTMAAVRAFQSRNGLGVDGLTGSATSKVLFGGSAVAAGDATTPVTPPSSDTSGNYTIPKRTLRSGYTGDDVKSVQTRLKELGYYTGTVDGKYGSSTMAAVKAFQTMHSLSADGLAGTRTYAILFSVNALAANSASGVYTTLRKGSTGAQVTQLQLALSNLKYNVTVNGTYDTTTVAAVTAFQLRNGLTADGVAGEKTQKKLYGGNCVTGDTTISTPSASGKAPDGSAVKLMHWFNEVKPLLRGQRSMEVYDPATGISFTLYLMSLGRHADVEPLTANDTAKMMEAFGGKEMWEPPKFVYCKMPTGEWCAATMHNVAHGSQTIKDNNFNGQNCVHFLRDMDECSQNDPKYGVTHQKALRQAWKNLTGQDIP